MQDILINDMGEVIINDGDFAVGFSDQQHQRHLIAFEKGALKANMTVGVGAFRYLEAEQPNEFMREIAVQFSGDGLLVETLAMNADGILNIKASYK